MRAIALGLAANRRQFWLLVLVNAFVGSMVGLERSVLPLLAEREFAIASASAALSFVASFGLVKAIANAVAGRMADRWGRRRILIAGWLFALPVPLLIINAPTWSWIVAANALLGVNQGLAWSMTVVMKIDLVGSRQRGFAMGLNEFAGYLAVALAALVTGLVAQSYGLRPAPFYLGLVCVLLGLAISVFFVRDTRDHVRLETGARPRDATLSTPTTRQMLSLAAWRSPALSSASHAGLINNLNDGLAWGLFPLFFAASGVSLSRIGVLAFVYPAVWGITQLWTGAWSDRIGRKPMIVWGMIVQGAALFGVAAGNTFNEWVAAAVMLGLGTAMVYPALLAAVGDVAHPAWRASAVGMYRLWRDAGYVIGALAAGILADRFGMRVAIATVAALTLLSGVQTAVRMPETIPLKRSKPRPKLEEVIV
jgi:MFS family permease